MALLLYCNFAIAQTGYIGWNVYQQQQQSTDTSLWLINANESLENKSIDGRSSVELGDNILGFGLKGISNTYAGLNPFNRAFSFVGDISATTGDLTDTLTARIGVSFPTDNITSILNANTNKLELEFEGGIIYNKLKLDNDGFSFNTTKDVLFNASEMTIDNVSSYFLSASQVKINTFASDIVLSPSIVTRTDKDIYVSDTNQGLVLKSPNGTCFRVQVNDTGNLTTTAIPCY